MCQSYENEQNKIINNYMDNVNKTWTLEVLSICFSSSKKFPFFSAIANGDNIHPLKMTVNTCGENVVIRNKFEFLELIFEYRNRTSVWWHTSWHGDLHLFLNKKGVYTISSTFITFTNLCLKRR